jgi:hypothetical protein
LLGCSSLRLVVKLPPARAASSERLGVSGKLYAPGRSRVIGLKADNAVSVFGLRLDGGGAIARVLIIQFRLRCPAVASGWVSFFGHPFKQ